MREAINGAAATAASEPTWTDVVSAVGAGIAALAAVATVAVAVVAALYARRQVIGLRDQLTVASEQLEEARTLRREQAQPYVVMSAVPNRVTPQAIEVVIQNLGTTGARDVTIACTPALVRTDQQGGAQEVPLPSSIPFLAPGQEWRTFWDNSVERAQDRYKLPDRHDVAITYTDSFGDQHTTPSVLDWGVFRHRMWMNERTIHHAAAELKSVSQSLKKLAQPDGVQRVAVYDGPQLEQKRAETRAEAMRRHDELVAEVEEAQVRYQQEHSEEQ
ncbi:hypothetical protein ACI780_19200 [Geodermatophilus sp. SYSU D00814]